MNTTYNIRIDKNIREQADALYKSMGLSLSSAINLFLTQSVIQGKLPINEVVAKPESAKTYGEQVLDLLKKKGVPNKSLEVNAEGHIIVDKDKDPELYDWAVNG